MYIYVNSFGTALHSLLGLPYYLPSRQFECAHPPHPCSCAKREELYSQNSQWFPKLYKFLAINFYFQMIFILFIVDLKFSLSLHTFAMKVRVVLLSITQICCWWLTPLIQMLLGLYFTNRWVEERDRGCFSCVFQWTLV